MYETGSSFVFCWQRWCSGRFVKFATLHQLSPDQMPVGRPASHAVAVVAAMDEVEFSCERHLAGADLTSVSAFEHCHVSSGLQTTDAEIRNRWVRTTKHWHVPGRVSFGLRHLRIRGNSARAKGFRDEHLRGPPVTHCSSQGSELEVPALFPPSELCYRGCRILSTTSPIEFRCKGCSARRI